MQRALSWLQAEWAVERNADVLDSFMKMPGAKPGRDSRKREKREEGRGFRAVAKGKLRPQASSRTL